MQKNMNRTIVYTSGEPAGVGPQLAYFLGKIPITDPDVNIVVLGDFDLIKERIKVYGTDVVVQPFSGDQRRENTVYVHHIPLKVPSVPAIMDEKNSPYVIELLDLAHEGLIGGSFAALVTGPISKSIIAKTGLKFSGHTEYLQEKCGVSKVVMLLGCDKFKVALTTTHLPLKEVASHITRKNLAKTLEVLHHDLQEKFHIKDPKIFVAGLNPHAGEDGLLGNEELQIIIPVLNEYRKRGFNLTGPLPADTLFTPCYLKEADAFLCMYHDQGLPVLKYEGFDSGYNTTLGLPYIRTSVDHGTALDLAGTAKAKGSSLLAAVRLAMDMMTP